MIIIYSSKYGSSKQYANWLAEELNCEALPLNKLNASMLEKHEKIIYSVGIYAGQIKGFKKFLKLLQKADPAKSKKLFLIMVGFADPADTEAYKKIETDNIPAEFSASFKCFALHGAMEYSKMSFIHKSMMKMMSKMLANKPENEKTKGDLELIANYGKDLSFVKKENISPLLKMMQES